MAKNNTFLCRFCQGRRPHNGVSCLGCGMPVSAAIDKAASGIKKSRCVRCGHTSGTREIEQGRYYCSTCGAVFEADDVGYLDTRPERNAEKREEYQRRQRGDLKKRRAGRPR